MKIYRVKIACAIMALVALCANYMPAQAGGPHVRRAALERKLQAKLDEWHAAGKFPGATLGVCLEGGECFALAAGFSDRDARRPMNPTDMMAAGSVGKTFVAAVALQLVKEGRISLDEKIEKYLGREPWFPRLPNARQITVRQLMNHTSGLVRYEFKEKFTRDLTANPDKVWKPEELLTYVFDEKAPFEAGRDWEYSDTNYIVLGLAIERVTGRRYYDLAQNRLLRPLKLERTVPQDRRAIKGLIQGYAGDKNPFGGEDQVIKNGKFIVNPQFEWTGGGMVSNAADLARWAQALYEGRAFDAALLTEMFNGVPAKLGRDAKYGLGVIIRPTAAGLTYGHSGFFPGYLTDMMYFPEHRFALAVQVNTSVSQNLGKPLSRFLVEAAESILDKNVATETKTAAEKKKFLIVLRLAPKYQDGRNWTEAENQAVGQHFEKLQQLRKEGKLIFASRTLVKESFGVVILEVETEAEARRVLEDDDAVKAGLMAAELLPFQTALIRTN